MIEKNERRPISNFFIKKSIQIRLITTVLLIVIGSSLVTTALLAFIYNNKSNEGSFFYMSNDIRQDIELRNLLETILPSVIATQAISIVIGLGIGMFSSRKMAVPLYKFEKWVQQLKNGKLSTEIAFREKGHLRDLTVQCNAMADFYRETFKTLHHHLEQADQNLESVETARQHLHQAKSVISSLDF
ncbi:MAG: hypothetical protein GF398_04545 [Chitinivibrionales bacterium]|nr:hypothetical protein [Chitinivibrionales bacterium]